LVGVNGQLIHFGLAYNAVSGGTLRMRMFAPLLAIVFCLLIGLPRAHAQSAHVASQSALDAAVQQHVNTAQQDRETVLRLLDRADVNAVAAKAGLDLRHAKDAVATLDDRELADAAAYARQAQGALAGGQSRVTISTTAIIIGLLVLILLIVALR
jgi:hypothetical protein